MARGGRQGKSARKSAQPKRRPEFYVAIAAFAHEMRDVPDEEFSLIRVFDRITATLEGGSIGAPMPPFTYQMVLCLQIMNTEAIGQQRLVIQPRGPQDIVREPLVTSITFAEKYSSFRLRVEMGFTAHREGRHWFDILVNDTLLTRIPLDVVAIREQHSPQSAEALSPPPEQGEV